MNQEVYEKMLDEDRKQKDLITRQQEYITNLTRTKDWLFEVLEEEFGGVGDDEGFIEAAVRILREQKQQLSEKAGPNDGR